MPDEETIATIKEEYEKQLEAQKAEYEKLLEAQKAEYEKQLEAQKEEHKQDIRALFAGRKETPAPTPEKSDDEKMLDALRKRFNLNKEN